MQGSETIVLDSQQYTRKDDKGKADIFLILQNMTIVVQIL